MVRELGLEGDFKFTKNWFLNRNYPTFRNFILPRWQDVPATYLELGVFEAQSLCWMLRYVLTHPDSRAVGVDPWLMTSKLSEEDMLAVKNRAFYNTKEWQHSGKCQLVRAVSAEIFPRMRKRMGYAGIKKNSVDICMIDGNHHDYAVFDDAKNVLTLMKKGGWMIFDDVDNRIKKDNHVLEGLTKFLEVYHDRVDRVFKHNFVECFEVR